MNANEPLFWMMISSIVIAVCFIVMAIALIAIALTVKKVIATVSRVEEKIEPLMSKVNHIGAQGEAISKQFTEISGNLSVATKYFSESAGLIREEIAELKTVVGMTAIEAKQKVALVSQTIDRTQKQVVTTTDFIQESRRSGARNRGDYGWRSARLGSFVRARAETNRPRVYGRRAFYRLRK
jgi:uncharacterized protein YoxC